MGKKVKETKRYNQRARSNAKDVIVDQTETNKIQLDLGDTDLRKYDESNPLALPSKKRKTTIKKKVGAPREEVLSKKQKKKLVKIVERREKKSSRADLVSELQNYQLPSATYDLLTPLVQVQTEGVKTLSSTSSKVLDNRNTHTGPTRSGWKKSGTIVANKQKFLSWSRRFVKNASAGQKRNDVLGFSEEESEEASSEEESESSNEMAQKEEATTIENPDYVSEENINEDMDAETVNNIDQSETLLQIQDKNTEDAVDEQKAKRETPKSSNASVVYALNKLRSNKKSKVQSKAVDNLEVTDGSLSTAAEAPVIPVKVPKKVIHVNRTDEIMSVRAKLPIIPEEHVIMEQITENLTVVLAGETGCGKTTQVPQFLYEAGYASDGKIIGITEPRRVAAISMAARVGKELSLSTEEVSFQIRFEGTVSPKTLIKFMTDGVLLKEMGKDFLLKKYSVICIDEAHERSLFTDILIGLLSRCVIARQKRGDPLKLIVMSATMRINDFMENSNLFKTKPGFVHIPARQFPVQIHFSKVTPKDYLEAAVKKVVQIHKKLPPGGILVFVTGQQEVLTVIKQLQRICPNSSDVTNNVSDANITANMKKKRNRKYGYYVKHLKTLDLDAAKPFPHENEEQGSDSDDSEVGDMKLDVDTSDLEPLHVLPLYSMLPIDQQKKVFEAPPAGKRLCVVTTNVAETSLTIPSIRYVVDTGKVKDKLWDKVTGVQTFKILWSSKASAEQRAGRAGRVGPGHCYRLFSSAVFEHEFQEFSNPEIMSRPVDDMVLLMKSMAIDNVTNFPYPTHPGKEQLAVAETTLLRLGALEIHASGKANRKEQLSTISPLGKTMAQFPVGPRFSKMIALSFNQSLTDYVVLLSAALTVQEVLLDAVGAKELEDKWTTARRKWAGVGSHFLLGDAMVLIKAVSAFELDRGSPDFCYKMGLRYKAMIEIRKLRKQLTNNINMLLSGEQEIAMNPNLQPPNEFQCNLLRQIILSGCPDRIARKATAEEIGQEEDKAKRKHAYKCGELEDLVFIHSSSVMRKAQPPWVVYQEAFEQNDKIYLRGVTAIEPEWVLILCPSMCYYDKPLKDPPPYYDSTSGLVKCYVKATYGKQGWELPVSEIEHPTCNEKYSFFAQFLLDGDIFDWFKQWRDNLLSLPKTMTKSWSKLQPRTQTILQALISADIDSKSKLKSKWETDPDFLLPAYLEWIPERLHSQVTANWPPL